MITRRKGANKRGLQRVKNSPGAFATPRAPLQRAARRSPRIPRHEARRVTGLLPMSAELDSESALSRRAEADGDVEMDSGGRTVKDRLFNVLH